MFVSKSVRMLCGVFSFFFIVRDHKHITCRSLKNIMFHELLYLIQVQLSFCDIPNNLRSIVFFEIETISLRLFQHYLKDACSILR